jgi:hypothetical protein
MPRHTRKLSLRARIGAGVGAVTAAAALVGGILTVTQDATPDASAAPGPMVVFGDSFVTAPDQYVTYGLADDPNYPRTDGCPQDYSNWPRRVAEQTGREVHDWSCNGMTSGEMLGKIDRAIGAGALNAGTGVVALSVGLNDWGPYGFTKDGNNFLDPGVVRGAYIDHLHQAAAKIRGIAPNAQIIMPGMLSVTDPNALFCPLNVIPDFPLGVPVPVLHDVENWNRDAQRDAANEIGARYIDVKGASEFRSTCSRPDSERMVAGWIDTTTPDWRMVNHPSAKGNQLVADLVKSNI